MRRAKKSFDDYVVYFKEGRLNDAQIAKEMGVSRVNVGKMRRKWEEVKDDHEYVKETAKLTIREDTLTNILLHASQSTAQARDLKSQFSMARSMLGIEFINSFSRYLELELKAHNHEIEILESKIISLDNKIRDNNLSHSDEESKRLEELKLKLDELKRERELKKMSLYYKTMLKLKATDVDVRSKF
ncbi:DUF603 domain-containing protein (plasmid) [Borrelia nietonii YOR]|uniref:DUF603 domain-containing protein n=1 Tax=Borrelia nietonii TaxID=3117462 RepID=UPI001FF6435C|nr:DUF603 domain-containing protein [Borrelia nietonii]UPA09691.1 DUF603 domain-containing protein [Borrelia nietonii YOR]